MRLRTASHDSNRRWFRFAFIRLETRDSRHLSTRLFRYQQTAGTSADQRCRQSDPRLLRPSPHKQQPLAKCANSGRLLEMSSLTYGMVLMLQEMTLMPVRGIRKTLISDCLWRQNQHGDSGNSQVSRAKKNKDYWPQPEHKNNSVLGLFGGFLGDIQ